MNKLLGRKNASTFELTAIAFVAALMGVGQNGLLVSLPFLVEHSAFNLPTWSIVIAIGSFLFLPSAPFWGRYSDAHGPKNVVLQALLGMSLSFLLLLFFTAMSRSFIVDTNVSDWYWLAGLVIARVIYGCTVSGMVPASQHWAILLCGQQNRLQAITSVSIGLSAGRLIGPLIAIGALKIHVFAPLAGMILFPMIALVVALYLPTPLTDTSTRHSKGSSSPWLPQRQLWPYLLSGLLLCAVIALLQYSFSPLILSITDWSIAKVSDVIGILLTISAAFTLATQVLVIKKKKMSLHRMYQTGALLLFIGLGLFLLPYIEFFALAMAISAIGAALLVPAYTTFATQCDESRPGAVAGYIAMSHTLGYGLASLLAYLAMYSAHYPIFVCIGFSVLILLLSIRPSVQLSSPSASNKTVH